MKREEITDGEDMRDLNVMTRNYVAHHYYVSIMCIFCEYLHDVIEGPVGLSPGYPRSASFYPVKKSETLENIYQFWKLVTQLINFIPG